MGKLSARIADLEKKRARTDQLRFRSETLEEERERGERLIAQGMRAIEEQERAEALLTTAERLALGRKELEEMNARPAPKDRAERRTRELIEREYRAILERTIRELELQISNEESAKFAAERSHQS